MLIIVLVNQQISFLCGAQCLAICLQKIAHILHRSTTASDKANLIRVVRKLEAVAYDTNDILQAVRLYAVDSFILH